MIIMSMYINTIWILPHNVSWSLHITAPCLQHFAVTSSFVHKTSRMLPLYDAALDERSLTRKKSLVMVGTNAPLDNMVATTANVHASGQSVDGWEHDAEMLVLKVTSRGQGCGWGLSAGCKVQRVWPEGLRDAASGIRSAVPVSVSFLSSLRLWTTFVRSPCSPHCPSEPIPYNRWR